MSIPYEAVPEASDALKFLPSPSMDAGPVGRLIFVDSVPLAWAAAAAEMLTAQTSAAKKRGIRRDIASTYDVGHDRAQLLTICASKRESAEPAGKQVYRER